MPSPWIDQIEIPEGKSGDVEVKHIAAPAGTKLSTASLRSQVIGGQKKGAIEFKDATKWHELSYDGGVWMTDYPCEQAQCDSMIEDITCGIVLVGGLGLGYVINQLCKHNLEVVVVEKSWDVIKLVYPHLRTNGRTVSVIHGDLFDVLARRPDHYTFAFFDIWQSDGEGTFFDTVLPLRDAAHRCGIAERAVRCWNEDVMRGQLRMGLHSRAMMFHPDSPMQSLDEADQPLKIPGVTLETLCNPPDNDLGRQSLLGWSAVFFQAVDRGDIDIQQVDRAASDYARLYGLQDWETRWEICISQGFVGAR